MDPEILAKIVETHTDVKHIMAFCSEAKETLKEHNGRIDLLEQQQMYLKGKLAAILITLGVIVTIIFNWIIDVIKGGN